MIQLLQNLKGGLVINSSYSSCMSPFSHPLGSFASIYMLFQQLISKNRLVAGNRFSCFSVRDIKQTTLIFVSRMKSQQTSNLRHTLSMYTDCVRKQFWNSCGHPLFPVMCLRAKQVLFFPVQCSPMGWKPLVFVWQKSD